MHRGWQKLPELVLNLTPWRYKALLQSHVIGA